MTIQAILPYSSSSNSAKLLASALNIPRIKLERSRFRHKPDQYVINWGNTTVYTNIYNVQKILNLQQNVMSASNKRSTLAILSRENIPCIDYTFDITIAKTWQEQEHKVYVRHLTRACSGRGIEIIRPGETLPNAPLYTKHFKKVKEYRVHVAGGSVIHIQQKRKRHDFQGEAVPGIRNYDNGWVFACNNVDPLSESQTNVAVRGVTALGLDFGAVDCLVDRENNLVICEINTAPGLEGTTLTKYVEYFNNF